MTANLNSPGSDDHFYASPEYDNTLNQSNVPMDPEEKERQEEEWRTDLAKLEEEIHTLKAVLNTKLRETAELKRRLGITPMVEFKQDLQQGFSAIKESEPVQKTSEKLHQLGDSIASTDAYQKTNAAFKSFGAFASKKLGDFRNSNVFKSVEDKVGGAYSSIKNQMSGSHSTNDFGDAHNNGSNLDSTRSPQ